jgi:hypothetical protein
MKYRDLCIRPLGANSGCKIDSALEYWQSSQATLALDNDPLSHIIDCTQYVFLHSTSNIYRDVHLKNPNCLNSLGLSIFPNEVLGGFQNNNYSQATAFILTFLVSADDPVTAVIWERGFLEIASLNYTHININYAAQVCNYNSCLEFD